MRKFHVRQFFGKSQEDWPCGELERFQCEFDDGVTLEVTTPRMEISSKFWTLHTHFPKLSVTSQHYIGNGPVPWSKFSNLLSTLYEDLYDIYGEGSFDREYVWKLMYRNINDYYNHAVVEYREYIRTVSAFDYNELYNHPKMVEIRKAIRPNPTSIQKAYDDATQLIMTEQSLNNNPVVSDIRTGVAKLEQALQVLVVRGYNTDIDDHIFEHPIMSNYYAGIHDPAEAFMDSALASKAYIWQGAPLERTQYGNRKLQFSSMRIDLLISGDCGSTHTARIEITKDRAKGLLGMYFKHPQTGELTAFKKHHGDEYQGQKLDFRTAVFCAHRDKRCVCTTCYGQLARNIPYGANIGFIASVNTQSEVSQRVLKVKHVESLTFKDPIILSKEERLYILPCKDSSKMRLNPELGKRGIKLLVKAESKDKVINASRLPVLTKADINPQRSVAHHSQFREIYFEVPQDNGKMNRVRLTVSKGSMSAFMTPEFLRWFVDHDFYIDRDGYYRFDLSDWDFTQPFLELPKKHMSMTDFATEVEVFIRSTRDNSSNHLGKLKQMNQYHDPAEAMVDLFDLITSRVSVHMTHVSIVCLSMMYDPNNKGRFCIPPINQPAAFAKYKTVLEEGSFSVMSAYQGGSTYLSKMAPYMQRDREQHLLDPLFMQ